VQELAFNALHECSSVHLAENISIHNSTSQEHPIPCIWRWHRARGVQSIKLVDGASAGVIRQNGIPRFLVCSLVHLQSGFALRRQVIWNQVVPPLKRQTGFNHHVKSWSRASVFNNYSEFNDRAISFYYFTRRSDPRSLFQSKMLPLLSDGLFGSLSSPARLDSLHPYHIPSYASYHYKRPIRPLNGCIPFRCFLAIVGCYGSSASVTIHYDGRTTRVVGFLLALAIAPIWFLGRVLCEKEQDEDNARRYLHNGQIV
jgi:hypothetical protein